MPNRSVKSVRKFMEEVAPDIVTPAQIAERCKVKPNTAASWGQRPDFPKPVIVLGKGTERGRGTFAGYYWPEVWGWFLSWKTGNAA